MVVEPYAVRIARPTAMPTIRATVTVEDAVPYDSTGTAETAAVDLGVTVRPNPAPNRARGSAAPAMVVSGVQAAMIHSPAIDATRPAIVTRRSDSSRTANPESSAPAAVAPASAPSASRCSSAPPYSTRSTNTAPPTMAVANAYPVRPDTSTAPENGADRNRRGSMNGSRTRSPRTMKRGPATSAASRSTTLTTAGSGPAAAPPPVAP